MKNLQNLNVVELSAQEVRTITGGGWRDDFLAGHQAAADGKDLDPNWSWWKKAGWYFKGAMDALSEVG